MNERIKQEVEVLYSRLDASPPDVAIEAVCQWLQEKGIAATLILDRLREMSGDTPQE